MPPAPPGPGSRRARFARLQGVWRSHDYGLLLEIGATSYRLYEETGCSRLFILEDSLAVLAEFYVDLHVAPGGNSFSARRASGVTRVRYRRLHRMPPYTEVLGDERASDPEWNLEVLWRSFEERYALFAQRGVDWDAAGAWARAAVDHRTGARRLFAICCEMLDRRHRVA